MDYIKHEQICALDTLAALIEINACTQRLLYISVFICRIVP